VAEVAPHAEPRQARPKREIAKLRRREAAPHGLRAVRLREAVREEAVRALEAVANYFRKNEPSSPVPLLCDRAKGLVSRGFLEVLADIAPDAVKQARAAGGLKD